MHSGTYYKAQHRMSYLWISKQWRERLTYAAMSAFVSWHTLAIIIGPAPPSPITQSLRPLFDPYLGLLYLDNDWGFFSPVVMSSQFRYTIEDGTGKRHAFTPTEGLSWYHPNSLWTRDKYSSAYTSDKKFSEFYGNSIAVSICRDHAALNPTVITLLMVVQTTEFWPSDHLAGKHPLDPEFARTHVLKNHQCSND